jgi:hypothetical protein
MSIFDIVGTWSESYLQFTIFRILYPKVPSKHKIKISKAFYI